jgi:hypothetical protein
MTLIVRYLCPKYFKYFRIYMALCAFSSTSFSISFQIGNNSDNIELELQR